MDRKMIDCRRTPSDIGCTLRIAGSQDEVLRAALLHATSMHGHSDTPDLRAQLRATLEDDRMEVPEPGRKVIDCRQAPSESGCSLTLSGREGEVAETAVAHAVTAHHEPYSPKLKDEIRHMMVDEAPPEAIAPNL